MNRKIQIIASLILIIVLLGTQVSYAISTNQKQEFFKVSSTEVSSGETLEMAFNLDKIEYNNFKIVLNSNIDNGEIYSEENVTIEENKDAIVIEIDKAKMNLSQIKLYYVVPENAEINSKIQLTAKIIVEEEIESADEEGNISTKKQEKTISVETQNVIVVEKEENSEKDNSQNGNEEKEDKQKDSAQKDTDSKDSKVTDSTNEEQKENSQNQKEQNTGTMSKPSNSNENMSQKNSQTPTNTKSGNTNMSSNATGSASNKSSGSGLNSISNMQSSSQSEKNAETATYNGSNNNYLKKLKVKGLNLNTTFNKENTTYFVNVTDTSSLKITATAEDSSAKVVVTGNDDIKEGTNKILIAVTAENGAVRYYRIIVNCKLS